MKTIANLNKKPRRHISYLSAIAIILLIVLLFTGCIGAPLRPISPIDYHNFFVKSGEFLTLCSYLISRENPQFKQVISRLYYSYFLIARTVHIGKTNKYERIKHDVVWSQNKIDVRIKYGKELKKLRTYYDYEPDSVDESIEETKNNLRFICDNEFVHNQLIEDARSQLSKFYKYEDNPQEWVEKTNKIIENLRKEHQAFVSQIKKVIL